MDIRQQQAAQAARQTSNQSGTQSKAGLLKRRKPSLKVIAIAAVVIIIFVAIASYFLSPMLSGVKRGQYQAVFLTNGQVYFGKLENPSSRYLTLTDVYYLQVENQPQEGQNQNQQTQGEPKLIKLGEELHGPEDEMKILQTQVSFWENLKNDSKIVKAIEEYKKK